MASSSPSSSASSSQKRLVPARPDAGDGGGRPPWAPRFPWRWVVLGACALGLFVGSYVFRERQKATVLRQSILKAYDQKVEPVAKRYRAFRQELENRVLGAAEGGVTETAVDERLKISGLHGARGLYLRLREENAQSREAIADAAATMEPDAITRCLGLSPTSVRTLYERGDFLERDWTDRIREEESLPRLEVFDDEVNRRYERDLPPVVESMRADYFLLAMVRGANRRVAPVDVYLWDLRRTQSELLRVRTKSRGMLLPGRIAPGGGDLPPPPIHSSGAVDCSIAAQVKAAAGERVMEVGSAAAALRDAPGEGDATGGAQQDDPAGTPPSPTGTGGGASPGSSPEKASSPGSPASPGGSTATAGADVDPEG